MTKHKIEIALEMVEFFLDLPDCVRVGGASVVDGSLVLEVESTQDFEFDVLEPVYEIDEKTGAGSLVGFEPL